MSLLPGNKAPSFGGVSYYNGDFHHVCLEDYEGYWLVLFFIPTDFGCIGTSSLLELEKVVDDLDNLHCKVVACSRSSAVVHEIYASVEPKFGGVHGVSIPILEDPSLDIVRNFHLLKEFGGHSFNGYFIINPEGVIRARTISDLPVAIHIKHLVRKVKTLINVEWENQLLDEKLDPPVEDENPEFLTKLKDTMTPGDTFYINNFLHQQDFPITKTGKLQSPINLPEMSATPDLEPLTFAYTPPWEEKYEYYFSENETTPEMDPQPTSVTNNGHSWIVNVPGTFNANLHGGPLDGKYRLYKLHCHWGSSEHSIHGHHKDGELHFVHYNLKYNSMDEARNKEDGICVVSVLLTINDEYPNPEIEKVGDVLELVQCKGESAETPVPLDMDGLLPADRGYYAYHGSFTTPDYSEVVQWIVMVEPICVSSQSVDLMKDLSYGGPGDRTISYNCRPIQKTGDREIKLYVPNSNQDNSEEGLEGA